MKLKALLWTGLFAVLLFFTVVYFGMKYDWVNEAKPKYSSSDAVSQPQSSSLAIPQTAGSPTQTGNGVKPELIDETPITVEETLGTSELSIEEVVTQCQNIATSVGIPEQQFEQAVIECIDRNSAHLKNKQNILDERAIRIREQCDLAITQRELLSAEEIKMLTDECVASMQLL